MKQFLLFALLLSGCFCFSQNLEKDTIQLHELVLSNVSSNLDVKKIKIKSNSIQRNEMYFTPSIVTYINTLHGKLKSVSLYFNERGFYDKKEREQKFKSRDFEILIFKVNEDGGPGEPYVFQPVIFSVAKNHVGEFVLDLSPLALEISGPVFIGLKRLFESSEDKNFMLTCVTGEKDLHLIVLLNQNRDGLNTKVVMV